MEAFLLLGAIALLPIYAAASGGLQVAHILLILFMALRFLRMQWRLVPAEVALLALFIFILVREGYGLFTNSMQQSSILEILYIMFSLAVVVTVSRVPLGDRVFARSVKIGLAISVVISWIGIWRFGSSFTVDDGELMRSIGTFNNPNQLGYYSICVLSIASILYLRNEIKTAVYAIFVVAALGLAIASLSKAAMMATFFATSIATAAMLNKKRLSGKLIVLCLLLSGASWQLYNMGALNEFHFVQRLQNVGSDSDDNLNERGYRSPFEHGALGLAFGLGEQKVSQIVGHEVHSTFWSYLMKYGLVGLGLFLTFWYLWFRRTLGEFGWLGVLLINVPASFYGITHNGSRFATFWLLIGISFNLCRSSIAAQKRRPSPYPPGYAPPYTGMAAIDWQANPRV